jgi:small subunit ribosomal protein S6
MPSQDTAYDLTLLLDPSADEAQRTKVLEDVKKTIAAAGAEVASNHAWGTRRTAFEIKHKGSADLHLIQFVGSPQLPSQLSHNLRITDGVVRFRIIRRPKGPGAVPDIGSMPEPAGASAPLVPEAPAVERL